MSEDVLFILATRGRFFVFSSRNIFLALWLPLQRFLSRFSHFYMVRSGGLYLSTLSSLLLKSPAVEDFISNRGIKLEFIDLEESVTNRTVHKSDGGTRFKKLKFCLFLYSKYKHSILIEILILNFFEF